MSESKTTIGWPIRLILLSSLSLLLVTTLTEYFRVRDLDTGSSPLQTSSSTNDYLIIPGLRVGLLTLGLSNSQVGEILGKGQSAPHPSGQILLYPELGLALYFEQNRLNSITVRNPSFETKQKIKVGVTVDTVLDSVGDKYEMDGQTDNYVLHLWEKGIHVGVEDNKVTYIMVTAGLNEPVTDTNSP